MGKWFIQQFKYVWNALTENKKNETEIQTFGIAKGAFQTQSKVLRKRKVSLWKKRKEKNTEILFYINLLIRHWILDNVHWGENKLEATEIYLYRRMMRIS